MSMIQEEEEWTQNQLMGTLAKQKGPIINFIYPCIELFTCKIEEATVSKEVKPVIIEIDRA
jgi:hypothetical protein